MFSIEGCFLKDCTYSLEQCDYKEHVLTTLNVNKFIQVDQQVNFDGYLR